MRMRPYCVINYLINYAFYAYVLGTDLVWAQRLQVIAEIRKSLYSTTLCNLDEVR